MSPAQIADLLNNPNITPEPCFLPLQVTLAGNAKADGQVIGPLSDADFVLTGIHGTSTGAYTVDVYLPSGRKLSPNAKIQNANLVGTASTPMDFPPTVYKRGSGTLKADLLDTSGAGNTIEIIFSGYNLYSNQ